MFDTEAFILQVQNQPSIWDNSTEKYNDRDERLIAWETIAKSMFGDNLSSIEKIAKSKFICFLILIIFSKFH